MKVGSEKLSDQAETTMVPPDMEQVPQVLTRQGGSEWPQRAPSTPEQPPDWRSRSLPDKPPRF